MGFQKVFKIFLLGFAVLSFGACASEQNPMPEQVQNTSGSANKSSENPLSPGNLPPPSQEVDSQRNSSENLGGIFFQRKEVWDSLSNNLKQKVWENYSHSASKVGAGEGGYGYYNTLFGRVSPRFPSNPNSAVHSQSIQGEDGEYLMAQVLAITSSSCSHPGTFLCVSRPADRDASVLDSVLVEGSINLSAAGIFDVNDPVILISVFKNGSETIGEFPLKVRDLSVRQERVGEGEEAHNIDIGSFSRSVPLSGSGEYTIVVTAFQDSESSVEPVAEARNVSRQSAPQIALVSILPPESGNLYVEEEARRRAAIQPGATVSVPYVNVTVRLSEANVQNVGVVYENYGVDAQGQRFLRYMASGSFSENTEVLGAGGRTFTATVNATKINLYSGVNHIKITALNKRLNELGFAPANPSVLEFSLTNIVPNPSIKLISPQNGTVLEGMRQGAEVEIRFCMTDIPSLPGRSSPAAAGQCVPQWPETSTEKPKVEFNGVLVPNQNVTRGSDGIYSARVKPYVGNNTFNISATHRVYGQAPNMSGAFGFGKINKLYENGQLKERDSFLSNAISIDIAGQMIRQDVKKALLAFLNSRDFKDSFASFFKNDDTGPRTACTETFYNDNPGQPELAVDSGDTSIEFLNEGFRVGDFEIRKMESTQNNRIELDVVLKGLHGEANLKGLRLPVQVSIGGRDASFIPLSISVAELRIKIGIKFHKNSRGVQELEIERLGPQVPAVEIVGNDPFGKYLHVNSTRNPLVAALEQFEQQSGAFSMQFRKGVESSILCGVETKLNHNTIGLGQWLSDLEKITGYNNQNPFRIPLEFDLLNKVVGVDIAYDVLRAESIQMDASGIHMHRIPLRITPSPRILSGIPEAIRSSIIGSISDPSSPDSIPLYTNYASGSHTFGLSLSESTINQALFAANLAGMLNLDIDPNFYTNNGIIPNPPAASTVGRLVSDDLDLNQNGVKDDAELPILMRLETNKTLAPYIHFLTQQETAELAQKVNERLATGYTFNTGGKYFLFTLPEVELSFYRVYPLSAENGGSKSYCVLKNDVTQEQIVAQFSDYQVTNPIVANIVNGTVEGRNYGDNGVCKAALSSKFEKPAGMTSCPNVQSAGINLEYEEVVLPAKNGPIISAVPVAAGEKEKPILKLKGSISFYGVFQGVFREVRLQDRFQIRLNGNAPVLEDLSRSANPVKASNFLRLKVLKINPADAKIELRIAENYTNLSLAQVRGNLANIFSEALSNCGNFNEIQIPIADRFPNPTAQSNAGLMSSLQEFGIRYLDLGDSETEKPSIEIDESRDNLGIGLHLGLCFEGETCRNTIAPLQIDTSAINIQAVLEQGIQMNR